MRLQLYTFSLCFLMFACQRQANQSEILKKDNYTVYHARGFEIDKNENYTEVKIRNPWDTTRYLQHYVLVPKEKEIPANLPKGIIIRTPVERVVAYATPHCGVLYELGQINRIVGVCESRFIDIKEIQEGVAGGKVTDLGEASAPDIEKIIELEPDIILASPFENMSYGRVAKTGIPIIECADYMEASPLARAEWIRFYSLFLNQEELADSLFNQTATSYLELKKKTKAITKKPTVFSEKKTGASWFVPGGNSYMACFYRDSGADYIWSKNTSYGSIPLAFEEVFEKASNANFWLLKHNAAKTLTYSALQQENRLYSEFEAFKNKNIFICNTGVKPFYEELPLHPDRVLADFIWIFHPELMKTHSPRYFTKMEE
ncbi:MAG: ABC transporter substrate-binding protein [Bacteroidales bacterium]